MRHNTHRCRDTSESIKTVASTQNTCCPGEISVIEHDKWENTVHDENCLERVYLHEIQTQ